MINFPPLFVEQMVQIILRNILNENAFPMQIRAAELFFRSQIVSIAEDEIMVADEATVNLNAEQNKIENKKLNKLDVDIDILRESATLEKNAVSL